MEETLSVRIPVDLVQDLGRLTQSTHQTRSELLREVIAMGLGAKKLQLALAAYRTRTISLGKAAEMAGIPYPQMLEELKRAGTIVNYDLDDLRSDLAWAERP